MSTLFWSGWAGLAAERQIRRPGQRVRRVGSRLPVQSDINLCAIDIPNDAQFTVHTRLRLYTPVTARSPSRSATKKPEDPTPAAN